MSCSCSTTPCSCGGCDATNEPTASALNNFITEFFGTLTKTCVNNEVVWTLPCDLAVGAPEFPRNSGEGLACYFLRYILENVIQAQGLPAYGSFYAIMPPDNAGAIAPGFAVAFPNDGPSLGGIARISSSAFNIPLTGTYEVNWYAITSSINQFLLRVNGAEQANTAIGGGNTNVTMTGSVFITTTVANSVLELVNPLSSGGAATLRAAPFSGQNEPFSAWLTIKKL